MTQPLAIVLYEKLLPGSQLLHRLQELNYRTLPLADAEALLASTRSHGPMLVLADLASNRGNICEMIARLKQDPATRHVPVVAFTDERAKKLEPLALAAGAALVVSDEAILSHLQEILQQALHVD